MSSVLIVESETWLGEHFESILTKGQFDVRRVSNAYAAMDMINEHRPDAVVMGLLLSGADGMALLHELQSYIDTAAIPVVICSDRANDLSLAELRPYGVQRLLDTGTMRPDDLPAAVRSVLAS